MSLRRHLLGGWDGPLARVVEVVFALAILIVVAESLGSFGLLTPVALLVVLVLTAASVWALLRRCSRDSNAGALAAPAPRRWAAGLALAVAAVTAIHWTGGVQGSLDFGIYRQDSAWYHLPLSAGIFQSGDTWGLRFTDPMALTAWFYPQNSELLHAGGMLALGNDFLSPFLNLGWMALALLAAWCAGRPFGRGPEALIAVAIVLDTGMMQAQAGNAPNDVAGVALLLATVAILLNTRAAGRAGAGGYGVAALLAAGLAAGLAIGTKITLLAPIAVLTLGLAWIFGRARLGLLAIWAGGVLLGGGYWYLRNLLHAGNPLPWISAGPLPGPDQASLYPRPPHSVADYATDPGIWLHQFAPRLHEAIGPLWPLLLLAAGAGLLLAAVRGPGLERALGFAGVAAVIAYALVPISASGTASNPSGFETNLRYFAPALALGLVLLPRQLNRAGARLLAPALTIVFAVDALGSSGWWARGPGTGTALALLLLAAPLTVALVARRRGPRLGLALAAAAALAIVALGYPSQRDYLRARYQPALAPPADNPGFRDTPQWRRIQGWALHVDHARIGLSGPPAAFGQYVFYDSDLTNRVRYLGEPGSHGSYRPITSCESWFGAINRSGIEFVVVTPASAFGPGALPQETVWLRTDPAAKQVLRVPPAAIFEIAGRLDPRACRRDQAPPILAVPGGGFAIPPTQ